MFYADGIHDDTLAIQELLNKTGIVILNNPGVYLVSKTLIIHSNTRFILSPGAKLKAAPMSKCALIENEHFACGGRDENIGIEGGIWDGNCDDMGLDGEYEAMHRLDDPYDPKLFKGKLIRFAHIDNISLEKMTVKDPVSYGIQIADVRGFVVRDIRFDYNCHFGTTDGVHINGPAYDGVIENLWGTTNDDMVSLTTIDEPHAEVSAGEISNVDIRNVTAVKGYSGIRLLSAGDFSVTSVHIDGVYGDYRHNAILISHHCIRPNTKIWFDDITIERVRSRKSAEDLPDDCFRYWDGGSTARMTHPLIWIEEGIEAGQVILRDISRVEKGDTGATLIKIDKTAKIDRLIMDNIWQKTVSGTEVPLVINEGTIGNLIICNVENNI